MRCGDVLLRAYHGRCEESSLDAFSRQLKAEDHRNGPAMNTIATS